jgi:hypothetical protein
MVTPAAPLNPGANEPVSPGYAAKEGRIIVYGLPKVSSSYPLSPRRGERTMVRGGEKKLLANAISWFRYLNRELRRDCLIVAARPREG